MIDTLGIDTLATDTLAYPLTKERRLDFTLPTQSLLRQFGTEATPGFCFFNNKVVSFFNATPADEFFSETSTEGTIQAKISPTLYVIKVKNGFITMRSQYDLPVGALLT